MQRALLIVAGVIFSLVAATHIMRVVLEVDVLIDGWTLPLWASLPAAVVLILLAFLFFRAAGR